MTQQPGWGAPPQQQGWGQPAQQQYPAQQQAPWGQQPAAQPQPMQGWGQTPQQNTQHPVAPPPGGDPFGGEKVPAISWKDAPIGATVALEVLGAAEVVQSRDFETNKLEFWEPEYPGAPPQPKWSVVVNGLVNGEKKALWMPKTSKEGSLCRAIGDAQTAAGFMVAAGTRLTVQLMGEEPPPPDRPRNSPRKLYRAKLEPGAPGGPSDAFQQPQAQQAPPAQAQQWGAPPPQQPPAQQAPPPDFVQPQGPPPGQWPAQQPPGYGPPPPAQQDAPPAPPAGPPANPWGQQQAPSGPPAGPPY